MNDMKTFSEWRKGRPAMRKPRKPSVKNPSIDAFVKSVDSLKKDMDQLDAVEKKVKPKPEGKPEEKPDDKKAFNSFKDYKKKRDSEEGKNQDEEEDDDEEGQQLPDEPVERPRVLPKAPVLRQKLRRPVNPEGMED